MSFPQYTLKMRGSAAIRINQKGYPEKVFDREELWSEYRKLIFPNPPDPDRRYVIERAIETLEGKSPMMADRRPNSPSVWLDRWAAAPARYPKPKTLPKRKHRSLLRRFLDWIRGGK